MAPTVRASQWCAVSWCGGAIGLLWYVASFRLVSHRSLGNNVGLTAWCVWAYVQVRCHQELEHRVLFPWVRRKVAVSDAAAIVHAKMLDTMSNISALLRQLRDSSETEATQRSMTLIRSIRYGNVS